MKRSIAGKRRRHGVETLKSRYGMAFVAPWTLGLILFFVYPLVQSVIYAFSETTLSAGGLDVRLTGLDNFRYALQEDPKFTGNLMTSLTSFLYSFPLILVISLILALILNQQFRGRLFFRMVYFLPVIIAGGVVLELIFQTRGGSVAETGVERDLAEEMIRADDIIQMFGLPDWLNEYFQAVMNNIMDLLWNSGIQIVLFIAGLQAIPDQLYEVSRVEGATKWEEFWFITFPMLSRILVLVAAFTLVEYFTSKTDNIMKQTYDLMQMQEYGTSSAMLWIYFLAVGALMAVLYAAFQRLCIRRWE